MARGRFAHTIDAKGRVSIPAGLRVELQAKDDRAPIVTNLIDKPVVGLFPRERWDAIEQRLDSMSQTKPEVQAVRRMLISGADEAPIDAQGRISIPQHLREYAGLEREVTIAGVGARVEIWDRARFEEELRRIGAGGAEFASVVGDLGL